MASRKPTGVYRRTTPDWFQHNRFLASGCGFLQSDNTLTIGIRNGDELGRICHVLGVNIAGIATKPVWTEAYVQGGYYSVPPVPLSGPDTIELQQIFPFFDLDPVPNIAIDVGVTTGVPGFPPSQPLFIPLEVFAYPWTASAVHNFSYGGASFYPDGGVAAFKTGRGFNVLCGDTPGNVWYVTFDCVMLND